MSTQEKYNRNQAIVSMVKDGKDYTYIGSQFNISRQAVYAIAKRYGVSSNKDSVIQPISEQSKKGVNSIVFPTLKKYLQENEISVKMFCEMIGVDSNTSSNMCRFLYGKTRKISIDIIKSIIEITGMDFQEIFDLK